MATLEPISTDQSGEAIRRSSFWLYRAIGGRFGYLLGALICLLLSSPLMARGWWWNVVLSLFASAVLVASLYAAKPGRRSLVIGVMLAAIDLGIVRLALTFSTRWLFLLETVLWLSTLLFVIGTILSFVFERDRVDIETFQAALCVYLLLAMIWLYIYVLIDVVAPHSFQIHGEPMRVWADDQSRRAGFLRMLIFSLSKLTSTAYDEVTPNVGFTNICGCLEALSGQIFLAVVIARLVAMASAQKDEV